MGRAEENTAFRCVVCGTHVIPLTNGSYRNHCPSCLSSLHVDLQAGDRASSCHGVMDAVDVVRSKKGWQIVFRCRSCGTVTRNRVAVDTVQPDDIERLVALTSGASEASKAGGSASSHRGGPRTRR